VKGLEMSAQTTEKKMVSRKVAIGLAIACIVLLASLFGTILFYSSTASMINDKDRKISELEEQITALTTRVANLTIFQAIANLARSITWVDSKTVSIQAGYETVWNATATYAGYVSVDVYSSTTSNIYARVTYSSYGVDYDKNMTVGMGGTAVFPVLPASIQISIGNLGTAVANATVTIIYHY
jgi:predicted PurR-regulated permease PerM